MPCRLVLYVWLAHSYHAWLPWCMWSHASRACAHTRRARARVRALAHGVSVRLRWMLAANSILDVHAACGVHAWPWLAATQHCQHGPALVCAEAAMPPRGFAAAAEQLQACCHEHALMSIMCSCSAGPWSCCLSVSETPGLHLPFHVGVADMRTESGVAPLSPGV